MDIDGFCIVIGNEDLVSDLAAGVGSHCAAGRSLLLQDNICHLLSSCKGHILGPGGAFDGDLHIAAAGANAGGLVVGMFIGSGEGYFPGAGNLAAIGASHSNGLDTGLTAGRLQSNSLGSGDILMLTGKDRCQLEIVRLGVLGHSLAVHSSEHLIGIVRGIRGQNRAGCRR